MATQTGSIDLRGANSAKLYVDDEAGEIRSEVSETYATKTEVRRTDTGTGTVVTSDDAASLPPLSLTIHGKSVQDGTPTPSAPVPIRSVQSGNLSPFFSHDFTDVYNASTNPNGYWRTLSTSNYTQLSDGWAHFEKSNITATTNYYFALNNTHPAWLKPNTTYTVYIHVKNAVSTGGTYVAIYASTGTNAAVPSVGTGGFVSESDHIFVKQVTTGADVTSQINILNGCVQMRGTAESPQSFTVDLRISIYEGAYRGAYTPVGNIVLESVGKNVVNCPDLSGTLSNAYLREFSVDAGNLAPFELVAGQTYTLSANVVSSVQQFRASVGCGNGSYALDIASKNNLTDGRMSITFTPTAAQLASGNLFAFRAPRYSAQTTFTFTVSDVQLEIGSTATAYEPYSSTTAPIPVTLRSLPYGTYDEWISGESAYTLVQRVGETMQAVTDGVTGTVGVDVLSSTGEIANGAQVLYPLATPQIISLGKIDLPSLPSPSFSMHVDAAVTPTLDAEWWTQGGEEVGSVYQRTSALEQTSQGFTIRMDGIDGDVSDLSGDLSDLSGDLSALSKDAVLKSKDTWTAWMDVGTDDNNDPYLTMGQSGNAFESRLTNRYMSFNEGTVELMRLSGEDGVKADTIRSKYVYIGSWILEQLDTGDMAIKLVGGE